MPGAYVLAWDGCRSVPYVVAMDITGASAIVTGGASGIGEACVRLLAKRGAKVVIVDMQDDKGKALATEVGGAFCHADVTNTDEVIAAVETAKEMGPLRVLVNSAGIGWASRTIGRDGAYDSAHDLGRFTRVISINLIGTFNCIRLAATAMSQTEPLADGERGAIVNMASVAAFDGQIGQAAYSASKGGVVGMTLPIAPRPVGRRRAGQHRRSRPHRHADLRTGRTRPNSSRPSSRPACCSRRGSVTKKSWRRWWSSS